MTSVTTKTGDKGRTSLLFSRRTSKDDCRIVACGEVDELSAALGLVKAHLKQSEFVEKLTIIQNALIALMGELATLPEDGNQYMEAKFDKLTEADTAKLEQWIDKLELAGLSFKGWALPGGSVPSAYLDFARTVCRRAERSVVVILKNSTLEGSEAVLYLNRLSDFLWLAARSIDQTPTDKLA